MALIGPNANATDTMQGNYKGTASYLISPLMGLQKMGVTVMYEQGCDVKCSSDPGFADAVNATKAADAVIVVVGLDEGQERCVNTVMLQLMYQCFTKQKCKSMHRR